MSGGFANCLPSRFPYPMPPIPQDSPGEGGPYNQARLTISKDADGKLRISPEMAEAAFAASSKTPGPGSHATNDKLCCVMEAILEYDPHLAKSVSAEYRWGMAAGWDAAFQDERTQPLPGKSVEYVQGFADGKEAYRHVVRRKQ